MAQIKILREANAPAPTGQAQKPVPAAQAPAQAAPAQANPQQEAQAVADAVIKIVTPIIQKAIADEFAKAQKGQQSQKPAPAQAPAGKPAPAPAAPAVPTA